MFGIRFKSTWPFITRKAMDVVADDIQPVHNGQGDVHWLSKVRMTKIKKIKSMSDIVLEAQLAKHSNDEALGLSTDWLGMLTAEYEDRHAPIKDYLRYLEDMDDFILSDMYYASISKNGLQHAQTRLIKRVRAVRNIKAARQAKYKQGDKYPAYVPTVEADDLLAQRMMLYATAYDGNPNFTVPRSEVYMEPFEGKGGTNDGGGASGDWDRRVDDAPGIIPDRQKGPDTTMLANPHIVYAPPLNPPEVPTQQVWSNFRTNCSESDTRQAIADTARYSAPAETAPYEPPSYTPPDTTPSYGCDSSSNTDGGSCNSD